MSKSLNFPFSASM